MLKELFLALRKHFQRLEDIKLQLVEVQEFNCEDLFRVMDV